MSDKRVSMEQMDRLWVIRWTERMDNWWLMGKRNLVRKNYSSQMRM